LVKWAPLKLIIRTPPSLLGLLWESIPQADKKYKQHFAPAPRQRTPGAPQHWRGTATLRCAPEQGVERRRRGEVRTFPVQGHEITRWYIYRAMVDTTLLEVAFAPQLAGRHIGKTQYHALGGFWTAIGLEVTTFLRVGDPRSVIVQTATELKADALVIGSHSKRHFLDIALGSTAKYVSQHVSCMVILVSPEKQT